MFETIFLHDAATLRISFAYSSEAVEKIKTVNGATWDKASKTWRAPLGQLDKVLRVFPDAALAPEVALAGPAKLPIEHFAETCAAAGVTLTVNGAQVLGSGGAWTQILQAEIDKRATQLSRLIASGWQPSVPREVRPAPVPETFEHITELDRVMARGEHRWKEAAEREEGYKQAAKRARFERAARAAQASFFEQEGL
jgi:hypothetical protein